MNFKLESVQVEVISNGYTINASGDNVKEDGTKEWERVTIFAATIEEVVEILTEQLKK